MLLSNLNLLATAPDGVARLRELILTLAVQGKLVPQDVKDEAASVLLKKIRAEKDRLIAEGKFKLDKALAPIAEGEMPFLLPPGWEWVRLGDIGFTNIGLTYTPSNIAETGTPVLRSNNVQAGKLDLTDLKRVNVKVKESVLVAEGDLLICARNGSKALVGKTALITGLSEPMAFGAFMAIFRSVVNGYVLHFINSPLFRTMISEVNTTTINQITQENLRTTVFPLPPLAEQSRIVTRVEELMRLCDALQAKARLEATQHEQLVRTLLSALTASTTPEELTDNWHRVATHFDLLLDRPEAVDALEQTILQLAVRGLLVPQDPQDEPASELLKKIRTEKDRLIAEGKIKRDKPLPPIAEDEKPFELPGGWEWVRLGEIADNRLGKMLDKAKNTGKSYPYLRNTNVQWRRIDLGDIKEISLEAHELDEFRLVPGDLLICEGGYPGRCAIWNEPDQQMYFQKALHRVRPRAGIATELVAISLEADSKAGNLDQHFTGATIKHFVGQALDRYLIPLPPLAEQSRIVARVTCLRALCADLRQRLTTARSQQALLAQVLVKEVA